LYILCKEDRVVVQTSLIEFKKMLINKEFFKNNCQTQEGISCPFLHKNKFKSPYNPPFVKGETKRGILKILIFSLKIS